MNDLTPPRPQDITNSDYDDGLWNAILKDEETFQRTIVEECAECGVPLQGDELYREERGKFSGLCNECTYLKLGLM